MEMKLKPEVELMIMVNELCDEIEARANGVSNSGGTRDFMRKLPDIIRGLANRRVTDLSEPQTTIAKQPQGEICHDDLHFDLGVIVGTEIYWCYRCGWEGKLSPVR